MLVGASVMVAGCGSSDEDPARAPYERYVQSMNAIQKDYAPDFAAANKAYIAFSRSELLKSVEALEQAVGRSAGPVRDFLESRVSALQQLVRPSP